MSNLNKIKVAFVDDHNLLREGIVKLMGKLGFETIFEAENGQVALAKLAKCENLPSVCIVDISMPVMDGFDLTGAITQQYPGIKVIAFSINDDKISVVKMLHRGAKGYVLKGADPDELEKAIETVHKGGQYFSTGVYEIAENYFLSKKNP